MTTVSDNFNRADTSDLGANWTEDSGEWIITSNTLRQSTAVDYRKVRWAGTALAGTNNYATATCANDNNTLAPGVFVRGAASAAVTYYAVCVFAADNDYLLEITAGGENILDTGSARASGTYTLRIEANGSSLTGTVNGTASTSATDSSLTGAGVGCMAYASMNSAARYIDDWEAGDLGGATAALVTRKALLGVGR